MFEKIVMAVAFSPSSLYDLVIYQNKLKKEYKKRFVSLLFFLTSLVLLILFTLIPMNNSSVNDETLYNESNFSTNLTGIEYKSKIYNLSSEVSSDSSLTANAGDRIKYELTATNNTADEKLIDISIKTNEIDEYGKLSLDYGGAFFDQYTKTLTWKNIIIEPNSSITKSYSATILLPLPESASNKNSYDCKIDTYFGNKLTINLNCSALKAIELFSSQLPTIPVFQTLFFLSFFSLLISFQLIRIRTLKKELAIIRNITTKGVL